MHWHKFIFSQTLSFRLLRHNLFWIAWWIYFSFCDYLYQTPMTAISARPMYVITGSHILLKTLSLVSIYAIACYVFIYFLLPLIIKNKWWKAAANILILNAFLFAAAYFMYWQVFPFVDSFYATNKSVNYPTRFWPAVYLGLINPTKVLAVAGIIKYVKYWWLKQMETERLKKEKVNAELRLLKAQVHPDFLFNALDNIYEHALTSSAHTSDMLLKLSDLLSYMLYECDGEMVPLEKEIAMMKVYMELEKMRVSEKLEMETSIKGDLANHQIAPFLLLPFIENSFKQSSRTGNCWINLDISMEGNVFHMKLANGMTERNNLQEIVVNNFVNVQKRLTLLYPQKHELKISAEQEMLLVHLKIQLDNVVTNNYEKSLVEELVG